MSRTPLLVLVALVACFFGQEAAVAAADRDESDPVGVWPLVPEPQVVASFEPPLVTWGSGHRGVDLAGRPAQPVATALDGTVRFAGSVAGKPVVVVDHGSTRTTYEPVAALVTVGDRVRAGDRIGLLMTTWSHCFPAACLHWGWRRGDDYLDPLRLVRATRVRLLPLWREHPVDAVTLGDAPAGRPAAGGPW